MTKDPEYRALVDKHGKAMGEKKVAMITYEMHQQHSKWARQAITMVEQKARVESTNLGQLVNICMMEELLRGMEVAEVYGPPRAVELARRMGLRAGWSLDITTCDEDGKSWDFNQLEMRNKAVRK